ncbi:MAG: hypothetical protein JNK48_25205 [Bryobacterales bacterium]|nr:hypothetical protein [Bryobacterales bacterium]
MKHFALILITAAGLSAQPRLIETAFTDIELPSEAADGGSIAVRLLYHEGARPLLAEGAPVVIEVPGGFEPGALTPAFEAGFSGFVYIRFLFPGGRASGRISGGVYDTRGPQSVLALRDVALYASGQRKDRNGRGIGEALPFPVLTNNVGLLGLSFGGNASTIVLARYGAELEGVRYFVGWENPTNAQIATGEPGPGGAVTCPANLRPQRGDLYNPFFTGYGAMALRFDYGKVRSDGQRLFFDGNNNSRVDSTATGNGCQTADTNVDNRISDTEDFPINGIPAGNLRYFSPQITEAAASHTPSWPGALANPGQSEAFWKEREAVRFYDAISESKPALKVMLLASVRDHVQTSPGHHHIRQAFEGFHRNNIWVTINPTRESLAELQATLATRTDIPENEANTTPSWTRAESFAYPETVPDSLVWAAAAREMARRP